MNKTIEQVKEFHEKFEHPVGNLTELEPLQTRQLRIQLLFEELVELSEASDCNSTMYNLCLNHADIIEEKMLTNPNPIPTDGDDVNQIEELDACCDLQYVLNGKILTSGLHNVFDENFDLVHMNNMGKAHRSVEHAQKTIEKLGIVGASINDKFILKSMRGKIIKPYDFYKVKLQLTGAAFTTNIE